MYFGRIFFWRLYQSKEAQIRFRNIVLGIFGVLFLVLLVGFAWIMGQQLFAPKSLYHLLPADSTLGFIAVDIPENDSFENIFYKALGDWKSPVLETFWGGMTLGEKKEFFTGAVGVVQLADFSGPLFVAEVGNGDELKTYLQEARGLEAEERSGNTLFHTMSSYPVSIMFAHGYVWWTDNDAQFDSISAVTTGEHSSLYDDELFRQVTKNLNITTHGFWYGNVHGFADSFLANYAQGNTQNPFGLLAPMLQHVTAMAGSVEFGGDDVLLVSTLGVDKEFMAPFLSDRKLRTRIIEDTFGQGDVLHVEYGPTFSWVRALRSTLRSQGDPLSVVLDSYVQSLENDVLGTTFFAPEATIDSTYTHFFVGLDPVTLQPFGGGELLFDEEYVDVMHVLADRMSAILLSSSRDSMRKEVLSSPLAHERYSNDTSRELLLVSEPRRVALFVGPRSRGEEYLSTLTDPKDGRNISGTSLFVLEPNNIMPLFNTPDAVVGTGSGAILPIGMVRGFVHPFEDGVRLEMKIHRREVASSME